MKPRQIFLAAVALTPACAVIALGTPGTFVSAGTQTRTGTASAVGTTTQMPGPGGSASPPGASTVTPVCGDPHPGPSLGPAPSLPSSPVKVLAGAFAVDGFTVTPTAILVFDGTDVRTYGLSGTPEGSFALPAAFTGKNVPSESGPVVDPSGDIWMDSYYGGRLDKFSPSGRVLWSSRSYPNSYIVGLQTRAGFRVGVTGHGYARTRLLRDTGQPAGSLPLALTGLVSQDPSGGWLVSGGGYVREYSASWHLLSIFGDPQAPAASYSGAPYGFYYQGSALQAKAGGPIYTIDPTGTIEQSSTEGFLEATTTLGGNLQLAGYNAYLVNGVLYFIGGAPFSSDENISSVPLDTLQSYLGAPNSLGTLGWGAGITSGSPGKRVAGNYFPYGAAPEFYASFVPPWTTKSAHLQLAYSIWSAGDIANGTYPPSKTISLPRTAKALAHVPLAVPAQDRAPGPYELQANLWDTAKSPHVLVGSTCVPYAVGAPGDSLDLSSLPSGLGFGGPTDPRGVVLNSQLGLNGLRGESIDWGTLLPHCSTSKPTAATCGPSALTFANAPQTYFQAAYLAQKDNVTYWVQVSTGDPVSQTLVKEGWWGPDVEAVVAYYTDTSHCKVAGNQCAPVTAWEPWNEANNTYSSDGATFTTSVLEPFYKAVKSADPQGTVVGGSSLGVDIPWWRQVVAAGGLAYMDVAGVHPYTGNNDSWEEDGTISQVTRLQALLHNKPIWFTEVGWWSNGPYNFLGQASTVARAMVWMKVLGIPTWNYFFDEGGFGNNGVSFSLIQGASTDDYVKPSALALMEASQQLAGRKYLASPTVPIPLTYEVDFGPTAGGTHNLATLWTQGLDVTAQVAVHATGSSPVGVRLTNQWGDSRLYQLTPGKYYALPLSDHVSYLSYPEADTLSVKAVEPFGTDLALSSAGATASASSSQGKSSSSPQPCCYARDAISGNLVGGWEPAGSDALPTITVKLPHTARIDRVLVDGHSLGSLVGDPRDFTVEVESPAGKWAQVATVTGSFYQRATLVQFSPVLARAVRVAVQEANYGGYAGGGVPSFWSSSTPLTLEIHAVQVYQSAPSGSPLQLGTSSPATTTTTQ